MHRKRLIRELTSELNRVEGLLLEEPASPFLQRRQLSLCRQLYLLHNPKRHRNALTYMPPERVPLYNNSGNLVQVDEGEIAGVISPKKYHDRGAVVTWAVYLADSCNGFWHYNKIRHSS